MNPWVLPALPGLSLCSTTAVLQLQPELCPKADAANSGWDGRAPPKNETLLGEVIAEEFRS